MQNLAIPKDRLGVTLRFDDDRSVEGTIFLGAYPPTAPLFSKVSALLEDATVFLPFVSRETGKTSFINKRCLHSIEWDIPEEVEREEVFTGIMHSEDVMATFVGGGAITGTLLSDAPREKARLSDCLNQPGGFLILKIGSRHMYVNKAMLREVVNR
jgi:hypothetical protein